MLCKNSWLFRVFSNRLVSNSIASVGDDHDGEELLIGQDAAQAGEDAQTIEL